MKNDFRKIINAKDALVLFYASWCGFSRKFLPQFEDYCQNCSKQCAKLDKVEFPELCKEYAIEYYPTVIWFKDGKVYKRLDSKSGIGLNKEQLEEFAEEK
jgi:thiol-disulfide isomerase/thioredoxin